MRELETEEEFYLRTDRCPKCNRKDWEVGELNDVYVQTLYCPCGVEVTETYERTGAEIS